MLSTAKRGETLRSRRRAVRMTVRIAAAIVSDENRSAAALTVLRRDTLDTRSSLPCPVSIASRHVREAVDEGHVKPLDERTGASQDALRSLPRGQRNDHAYLTDTARITPDSS